MRYLVGFSLFVALGVTTVASCGDDAATLAPELFGTWVFVNAEENGMSWGDDCLTNCATLTFNADGTYVMVTITPPHRGEGTWSTQGSILTLTRLRAGPDANNLQPFDPPRITTFSWSVSGDTLAMSTPLVTFYYRKESAHEDAGLAELRGL